MVFMLKAWILWVWRTFYPSTLQYQWCRMNIMASQITTSSMKTSKLCICEKYPLLIIGFCSQWASNVDTHDDIIKWKHFPCYWPLVQGIHQSSVNSPHKGHWCGDLMCCLFCACTYGWVNNGDTGDVRCHRTHFDFIVMCVHVMTSSWKSVVSYDGLPRMTLTRQQEIYN